ILRDPYLNEEQKQTLARIYVSFRNENEDKPVSPPVEAPGEQPASE
ncbi:MAG: hypothetical protein QOF21_214, partial [Actinomycetota bacterium]